VLRKRSENLGNRGSIPAKRGPASMRGQRMVTMAAPPSAMVEMVNGTDGQPARPAPVELPCRTGPTDTVLAQRD
jgi:hypothetical protein